MSDLKNCYDDAPEICLRNKCEHAEIFKDKLYCLNCYKWFDLKPVKTREILADLKKKADKLVAEGYTTPGEILEVLKPIRTGYDPTPDDFDFTAKHDEGKLQIHLVPPQIIRDIAEVRMYGNAKYGDPDNWKTVEKWRYVDALLRHLLLYLEDPDGVDEESGIKHYKHAACNMAFICEMESWTPLVEREGE